MNVTKVMLLRDQALFNSLYLEGSEFYVTAPYRHGNSTEGRSDVFDDDMEGTLLGTIEGHYFDFGDKGVFAKVD